MTAVIYDEAQVPVYTLPDLLALADGTPVADAATWYKRRVEVLQLFATQVYGKLPEQLATLRTMVTDLEPQALQGLATRKQVTVHFTESNAGPAMHLLIYAPNATTGPHPAFLGLNFAGNHAIHPDPGIHLSQQWMRENPDGGIVDADTRHGGPSHSARTRRWSTAGSRLPRTQP